MNRGEELAKLLRHLADGGEITNHASGITYKITPDGFQGKSQNHSNAEWQHSILNINYLLNFNFEIIPPTPREPVIEVPDTRQVEL